MIAEKYLRTNPFDFHGKQYAKNGTALEEGIAYHLINTQVPLRA